MHVVVLVSTTHLSGLRKAGFWAWKCIWKGWRFGCLFFSQSLLGTAVVKRGSRVKTCWHLYNNPLGFAFQRRFKLCYSVSELVHKSWRQTSRQAECILLSTVPFINWEKFKLHNSAGLPLFSDNNKKPIFCIKIQSVLEVSLKQNSYTLCPRDITAAVQVFCEAAY